MKTGDLNATYLHPLTVSCDVKQVFMKTHSYIAHMLQVKTYSHL
jgi:hypothetical protein